MIIQTYGYYLQAAETRRISARGRVVRGISGELPYRLSFNGGAPTSFQTGISYESPGFFDSLEITNSAPVDQYIELMVADGPLLDNRIVGQIDVSGGLKLAASTLASHGAVTVGAAAVLVRPQDLFRAAVLVQNIGGAEVYVGTSSSVTVANGIMVPVDGSARLTIQSEVWAISGAAGQDVRWLDERI